MNERDKDYFISNKNKIIRLIILILFFVFAGICVNFYHTNSEFRTFVDNNILSKELEQKDVKLLQVTNLDKSQVISYNNAIAILRNNQLEIYDSDLKKQEQLEIKITNLIYDNCEKYAVLAEENGQKVYLVKDKQIVWEEDIEGSISNVYVNKNGYVAITTIGTSHKTIISMMDPTGKKMFNSYLSKTLAADVSISEDNKYLAFAEIDASGAVLKSTIKVVSVEKIQASEEDVMDKVIECELNSLVTNIEYTSKGELMCMYSNKITIIEGEKERLVFDLEETKVTFQSVDISNSAIIFEEEVSGIFSINTTLKISDGKSADFKTYEFEDSISQIETAGDVVAVVSKNTVEIINTKGWLVKKYIASQDILDIVLSEGVAGIVYKDRIELIKL